MKDKIIDLLKQGKTLDEIKALILEGKVDCPTDAKGIKEEITKALDDFKIYEEAQKAFNELDSDAKDVEQAKALEDTITEKVASALEVALKKIPATSGKSETEYEFKSDHVSNARVTKDNESWQRKMCDMLRADTKGDFQEASKIGKEFLEKSVLYSDDYKKKLLRGDAVTGSYAVPDEYSDMVISLAQRDSNIYGGATKINMSSDKLNILGSGDVTFTEVTDQTTALTQSEPVLTQDSLDIIDAGALSYMHQNLIDDSNVNMVTLLVNAYGRGLTKYLKRSTTVGNVATTGDKINGIYSISGIGSVPVLDAVNGTITYDDILNLMDQIDEVYDDGAMFEMHKSERTALRKIKDNDGRPIFQNPQAGEKFSTLLGHPIKLNNQMPATLDSSTGARTAGNESTILFGVPSEVFVGFKGGMEFESSMHYKFANRQMTYRGFIRWDMLLKQVASYARLTKIKRSV